MTRRRPLYLLGFGALAVPLLAASFAYACGALASLSINPGSADAGATVNGTGANFASVGMGAPTVEPVVIRLGSRTGPTLWAGRPDATGAIAFAFQVPKVDPGTYVVLAMQNNADGQPASGTPVRATLEVTGPAPVVAAPVVAPAPEPAAAPAAAAAPAPAQTPVRAAAPRVRVAAPVTRAAAPAPAAAAAPAVAPAVVPDPVTPAPAVEAPVAAQAPAVTPAPESVPATAPARRSVMVSMSGGDDGSPVLAIALVGIGLVLALGASALVLAGRREGKAPARARR